MCFTVPDLQPFFFLPKLETGYKNASFHRHTSQPQQYRPTSTSETGKPPPPIADYRRQPTLCVECCIAVSRCVFSY
jgi:hypothetical protein